MKPLIGQVAQLGMPNFGTMTMDSDGRGQYLVGTGGITYNYRLGNNCMDIVGVHIEPGVSTKYAGPPSGPEDPFGPPQASAYTLYACVGNEALITGGELDGNKGFVIGKISGYGVTLGFDKDITERMNGTERFSIRACGVGLEIEGAKERVMVHNISPEVLEGMGITEEQGKYIVPVKKVLPGFLVGPGIGGGTVGGSGQIMTDGGSQDMEYGLNALCFGDYVAITDIDMTSGRTFCTGAVAICQIVAGDSPSSGDGPCIMTVLASKTGDLLPVIDEKANLVEILGRRGYQL